MAWAMRGSLVRDSGPADRAYRRASGRVRRKAAVSSPLRHNQRFFRIPGGEVLPTLSPQVQTSTCGFEHQRAGDVGRTLGSAHADARRERAGAIKVQPFQPQ
jgi:hypothetical protein